jgi:hypothetical protein
MVLNAVIKLLFRLRLARELNVNMQCEMRWFAFAELHIRGIGSKLTYSLEAAAAAAHLNKPWDAATCTRADEVSLSKRPVGWYAAAVRNNVQTSLWTNG